MTKQAIQHSSTQKTSGEEGRKRGEEKANLFENRFRSGGEENERRMANNVNAGDENLMKCNAPDVILSLLGI